jgi:hydrogenase-4 component B
VATAFIIFAFLLIYKYTGSFEFGDIRSGIGLIPPSVKNLIFLFGVIGFGTKAGIIPFHIWLPAAHSTAPSHISAFMSGVMIKTGIYMMIRVFLDILYPVPAWWGLSILIIGSVSSLLGVLYALTEHDIKRLLAYHSIENIGIILLGIGSAMTFSSLGMMPLALLGLTAALFHTLNHATFKSLLFLGAGSVINETHTRNMEEYGGLIKFMPQTAFFFLVGSMAISALPPFNGFFSEWLTFQTLFQGLGSLNNSSKWAFITASASLAFTGGLALACFVKAFGSTFLARPRSPKIANSRESSLTLRLSMGSLAVLCLAFGIFSGFITFILGNIGRCLSIFSNIGPFVLTSQGLGLKTVNGFASVSGPVFFALISIIFLAVLVFFKYFVNKNQKQDIGETWNCGAELTPRMEITATGFSSSIITIFKGILRPSIQHEIEYHDSDSRFLPKSRTVTVAVNDIHRSFIYTPLQKMVNSLSERAKNIQGGNISVYILYIFITLVVVLYWVL